MKKSALVAGVLMLLLSASAEANCYGGGAFQTCTDSSGNSYTVQRFGNQTITNGYNSNTGTNWTQNTQTYGGTTYYNGTAGNGNNWNMIQQNYGGGLSTYSGTDSNGNSFFYNCNSFGCN